MSGRLPPVMVASLLSFVVSGCPVTDDYYLLPSSSGGAHASSGSSGIPSDAGSSNQAGDTGAGFGGEPGSLGGSGGRPPLAGAGGLAGTLNEAGGPSAGAGGAPEPECVPQPERCNGKDEDCDSEVDEVGCAMGCVGFVLGTPEHGYMFCGGPGRRTQWSSAKQACAEEGLKLAWIETAQENAALRMQLDFLTTDTAVFIGATDAAMENQWKWDGGPTFWVGEANGDPVANAFEAWGYGLPNSDGPEDCGSLNPNDGAWNDQSCYDYYAYVCEQPD
jgi:hypothetical protein